MPIPLGMGTHSEAGIYRRGKFFDQAFGIFPAQTRVGNGLTVSERLTADDFLRSFAQETFRHNSSNRRRAIADLLTNILTNF